MRLALVATALLAACGADRARVPARGAAHTPTAGGASTVAGVATGERAADATSAPVCAIDLDTSKGGGITINGARLDDLRLDTIERALGAPDRTERSTEPFAGVARPNEDQSFKQRAKPSEIVHYHHVYDRLGLVFSTNNGPDVDDPQPRAMGIFLTHPRKLRGTYLYDPPVTPAERGACSVRINGHAIDPEADLRPADIPITSESDDFLGQHAVWMAHEGAYESVHSDEGPDAVFSIFLDDTTTGRPSYVAVTPLY